MKLSVIKPLVLCVLSASLLSYSPATRSQTKKVSFDSSLSNDEKELLTEINLARAQPRLYATYLEGMKPQFNGKDYKPVKGDALTTEEGWSAVEDAIKFLRAAKPIGPLRTSQGLCLAANSHVKSQGENGTTGHKGTDSTFIEQRVKPYGVWQGGIGENLTYGNESARERLLTWLIDDGFASRGHRKRLMSADYQVAGVSCGPHPEFGAMCVLTLAGSFVDAASIAATATPASSPAKTLPTTKTKPANTNNKAKTTSKART